MSIEYFEEEFLKDADKCPKDKSQLKSFNKFTSGSEFIWMGWCDDCKEDKVTIHGNNPSKED